MSREDKEQLAHLGVYLTFSCAVVCLVTSAFFGDRLVKDCLFVVGIVLLGLWSGCWLFWTTLKHRP